MQIYATGFRIECKGDKIGVESLLSKLAEEEFFEFKFDNQTRVFAIESFGPNYLGVTLSNRDQNSQMVITTDKSGNKVAKHMQIKGGKACDFSFFFVSPKTGNGILSHYHGGGGIVQFRMLFKSRFLEVGNQLKDIEIAEALEVDPEFDTSPIAAAYDKSKFKLITLQTDPNFDRDIKRLKNIQSFDYVTPVVDQKLFSNISKLVRYQKSTVQFAVGSKTKDIREWITKFVKENEILSGKARGKNKRGVADRASIDEEAFCMKKYPYNDYAPKMIKLSNFDKQKLVKKILELADEHPELF